MADIRTMLGSFAEISANPKAQLEKAVAGGKKAVGVLPYFCPEELVYAAGMLPFGLWGAEMQTSEAKRYFPAFICSILQTTLELGIRGELDALSAIMVPICCDSLKSMGTNWEYGVKNVPVINVAYAQNRKIQAGIDFTVSQFEKIRRQLEAIAGRTITDGDIAAAIAVYNDDRRALSRFVKAAAAHPELVSPAARCAVIKSGYFMDRKKHADMVLELCAALEAQPEKKWPGPRIVTTGIIADSPELLKIFGENGIAVVGDQTAHESVNLSLTPVTEKPIAGMAQRLAETEGCCVLFDPGKKRGKELVRLVRETGAGGVIWVMTKFCDPEEFDFVPVKRMLDKAGIPLLAVEVDQQMVSYGQIRSAVQAFCEMLG